MTTIKRICVTDAIALMKPIEHDPVAMAFIDQMYSIVTSGETCEMEHCTDRAAKARKQ